MRVPLSWLGELVPLPADCEALARRLTSAGVEVTAVERVGGDWEGVVVGRVLEVAPHPNADRLRLVTVDIGGGEPPPPPPPTVVCGAPNVAAGQRIAFAGEGALLTDPATGKPRRLKKSRIRGVVSGGMVCSEAELGLSGEHAGILVLDTEAAPGTPLREVLGDRVFALDLTPNRVDALSLVGLAREVSALTGAPLTPRPAEPEAAGPPIAGRASAEIADSRLCRRFTLALIEGVEPGPSPEWMQARLAAAGLRPINNLVDITNYVMLECGQPVHAFDYDRVAEHRILVRPAEAGETLVTLDGKERELDSERLVIADPSGPIALAGVMGGRDTEITDGTRNLLLEAANFDPVSVRRTARRYDLFTDAARRFAWGLPPESAPIASARVCRLLERHAGGRVAAGRVDVWPAPEPAAVIRLRRSRIPQVLGMAPADDAVDEALSRLGFRVESGEGANGGDDASLSVTVPWWRRDVRLPDDLVEEVARVTGYDDLPAAPLAGAIPRHPPLPARSLRERVRDLGAAAGLSEVMTYSLVSDADLAAVLSEEARRAAPALRVANPLGEARDSLRTSLRPGVLRAAALNFDRGASGVALFEVSRVYRPGADGGDDGGADGRDDGADGRPEEAECAAAVVVGARRDRFGNPAAERLDFFDAKATLEQVLAGLGLSPEFRAVEEFGFVAGRTAEVRIGAGGPEAGRKSVRVGTLGQAAPASAAVFGLEEEAFVWELDLAGLLRAAPEGLAGPAAAAPLPRFPAAAEDFAFLAPEDTAAGDLVREAESHPLVVEARVFDDYRLTEGQGAESAASGSRSLGVRVLYRAPNRTLNENDIAKVRRTILKRMKSKLGAVVRDRA